MAMNGSASQQSTVEIELAPQERVSLDDVLSTAPGQTDGHAAQFRFAPTIPAAAVGTLTGIDESGRPLVAFPADGAAPRTPARSTVALGANDAGREVVVVFEEGDAARPIIVGLVQPTRPADAGVAGNKSADPPAKAAALEAKLDGQRVVLEADREIVLRCGQASITLTRAGKVLIRGAYLLSRSSGVNRIKGGSVQIN
jgi:hypothetical protein